MASSGNRGPSGCVGGSPPTASRSRVLTVTGSSEGTTVPDLHRDAGDGPAAHHPDSVAPSGPVRGRRRRLLTGGALLSAVAVAVGALLAPSSGSGTDRLPHAAPAGPVADRSRQQVEQAHDAAVPARTAAFVERCVGGGQHDLAPEHLGLTEDELRTRLAGVVEWRPVGRDGECLGRRRDLRPERVNVVLEHGRVVWAARF